MKNCVQLVRKESKHVCSPILISVGVPVKIVYEFKVSFVYRVSAECIYIF